MTADSAPVNAEVAAARTYHATSVAGLLARGASDLGARVDPERTAACAHAINGASEALATFWRDHPQMTAEQIAKLATDLVQPGLRSLLGA
jgi:hypothetical protein